MKRLWEKSAASAMDGVMCGMMNLLQWRRGHACTHEDLHAYLTACEGLSREQFFSLKEPSAPREEDLWLKWETPLPSGFPENDRPRVKLYTCPRGPSAPTVLILHALMSANDFGYRRVARWFNDRGWNAAFPHLPYHYSRTPRGYFNGELAITANLIRNGETLRQAVMELRQLMAILRARGCREFAILGTSYGGWTGSLLSFVESDLRFLALIQPIVNVEAAIWENPGSASLRRILRRHGIPRGASTRHAHLSSPMHGEPLCPPEHVILTGGAYDSVSPLCDLETLHARWSGSRLLRVRQGHFGYSALPLTLREVSSFL